MIQYNNNNNINNNNMIKPCTKMNNEKILIDQAMF